MRACIAHRSTRAKSLSPTRSEVDHDERPSNAKRRRQSEVVPPVAARSHAPIGDTYDHALVRAAVAAARLLVRCAAHSALSRCVAHELVLCGGDGYGRYTSPWLTGCARQCARCRQRERTQCAAPAIARSYASHCVGMISQAVIA
jgi:hypothetical protein